MAALESTNAPLEGVARALRSDPPLQGEIKRLVRAARLSGKVTGLTHTFYRYPGRFSPEFARVAIENFTRAGDVVYDPFMGGGTVAVEALTLGRRFVGTDVNPISRFLTMVKTTPLEEHDGPCLVDWAQRGRAQPLASISGSIDSTWAAYVRHVPWWLRARIHFLLQTSVELSPARLRNVAKCSILRAAQWALDGRRSIPTDRDFCDFHEEVLAEMLAACVRLGEIAPLLRDSAELSSRRLLLLRRAEGAETDRRLTRTWRPVRLVLTSPPYPGVHVLYHRWQVQGRRETAAPFWIVGAEDGRSAPYYTMGPRYASDLSRYLRVYENSFRSVAKLIDRRSSVVQMIGFSQPEVQVGPVLDAMSEAGFHQIFSPILEYPTTRAWRVIPNRRWYAGRSGTVVSRTGREAILVHQLSAS